MIDWVVAKFIVWFINNQTIIDRFLRLLILNIFIIFMIYAIADTINYLGYTIFAVLFYALLKIKNMKYHSKSVDSCAIMSSIMYGSLLIISNMITVTPLYVVIFGSILCFWIKDKFTIVLIVLTIIGIIISYFYANIIESEFYDIIVTSFIYIMILTTEFSNLVLGYYDLKLTKFFNKYFSVEDLIKNESI